jgi:hypothetical protein
MSLDLQGWRSSDRGKWGIWISHATLLYGDEILQAVNEFVPPLFRHSARARAISSRWLCGHAAFSLSSKSRPSRAFLLGLARGCFEKRFGHNTEAFRVTNRSSFCSPDASQLTCKLRNAPYTHTSVTLAVLTPGTSVSRLHTDGRLAGF